jgi:hypothetical protein
LTCSDELQITIRCLVIMGIVEIKKCQAVADCTLRGSSAFKSGLDREVLLRPLSRRVTQTTTITSDHERPAFNSPTTTGSE